MKPALTSLMNTDSEVENDRGLRLLRRQDLMTSREVRAVTETECRGLVITTWALQFLTFSLGVYIDTIICLRTDGPIISMPEHIYVWMHTCTCASMRACAYVCTNLATSLGKSLGAARHSSTEDKEVPEGWRGAEGEDGASKKQFYVHQNG